MIRIKVFVPSYFKKFRCIADKCPDTCCAGWEADLDGEIIETDNMHFSIRKNALGFIVPKALAATNDFKCKFLCPKLNI